MLILISSFLVSLFLFVFFGMGTNSVFNIVKIYKPIKSVGTGIITGILVGIFIAFT